ncbi:MAG: TonB-dependent receptor [Proteobacteria bacterium]|nr:TonB-dependent receptor [Pseudomonadota bacterium]
MAFASALAALVSTANAADENTSTTDLQEIVVTARLRSESLQEVPMAVDAFSAKTLQDAGVKDYGDFVALTPNVSLVEAESVGQSFLTIRGLSEVRNGQAPVAFVVDGVQESSNRAFTQTMFDLDSVQVLKGPQGALYGRNASGGAIVITTKQPTNQYQGYVSATGGSGGDAEAQGVVSGPILPDQLLFRLAGAFASRDGYFDNTYLGKKADPYEDVTVRGLLKWMPTEALTADLRLNYSHTNGSSLNYVFQSTLFDPARPCFADPNNPFGGPNPDPNLVSHSFCANNRGRDQRDLREVTGKVDYKLPGATLTGIFSYNTIKEYTAGDQFPYTASRDIFGTDGTQTQFFNIKNTSAEMRLTSDTKQALRWMFGAYYLRTSNFTSSTTGSDLGMGIDRVEYDPLFNSPTNPTLTWFTDTDVDKVYAGFGNVSYDVTSQLEASLALRYDKDEASQTVDNRNTGGLPPGCLPGIGGACERSTTFSRWQPKVSLKYQITPAAQVYASWGEGFRSGLYNPYGTSIVAAQNGLNGINDVLPSELTSSYEIGFKSEWLDHTLRVNGAGFYTKVKGQQYFVFLGGIGAQILVSIDQVRIEGGELEVVYSPVHGLDLYASLGVSASKIERYNLDPTDVGNWAPYVPQTSENAGAQYRFPISSSIQLLTRADFIVKGAQYWDPENTGARSAVELLNLRAGLEDIGGKWSLTSTVTNATNKSYNAEFVLGGFAQPAPGREWTVEARYNF